MNLFDNIKSRQCEANKKTSYAQRSPIQTKRSLKNGVFSFEGQKFKVTDNEILESALFERVTRDCKGDIITQIPVRRFRKVGCDEWFTVSAAFANDIWDTEFTTANDEEAISQAKKNNDLKEAELQEEHEFFLKAEGENPDKNKPLLEETSKQLKKYKTITTVLVIAMAVGTGFYTYKLLKQ